MLTQAETRKAKFETRKNLDEASILTSLRDKVTFCEHLLQCQTIASQGSDSHKQRLIKDKKIEGDATVKK